MMLGKLNCYGFAFAGLAFNLPWPLVRNPWDVAHSTAGSSSGTGSDTSGSVRDPAALCGVAGIKPTYGLQPLAGSALIQDQLHPTPEFRLGLRLPEHLARERQHDRTALDQQVRQHAHHPLVAHIDTV